MKKRISVLIVVLAAFFGLAGCTSSSETLEYDEETIQQATEFLIEYCNSVDEDTVMIITMDTPPFDVLYGDD